MDSTWTRSQRFLRDHRTSAESELKARVLSDDKIVALASALGEHANPALDLHLPAANRWIAWDTSHFDLLSSAAVYEQIRRRVEDGVAAAA